MKKIIITLILFAISTGSKAQYGDSTTAITVIDPTHISIKNTWDCTTRYRYKLENGFEAETDPVNPGESTTITLEECQRVIWIQCIVNCHFGENMEMPEFEFATCLNTLGGLPATDLNPYYNPDGSLHLDFKTNDEEPGDSYNIMVSKDGVTWILLSSVPAQNKTLYSLNINY